MPQWVHTCVREYMKKGFSKEEAMKRCMGAYEKQKQSKAERREGGDVSD